MSGKLHIRQLAEQTGLSISTVSRVLAGKRNTSARSRQRVFDCAKSLGVLQGMSTGRLLFNKVMVFAPRRAFDVRADIFYFKVIEGVRDAVVEHDTRLSFCALEEHDSDVPLFLRHMTHASVDAAILVGIDDPLVHAMAADVGKPCVLVNGRDTTMRLDAVMPDHAKVGEQSAAFLLQHGHRDIVCLLCLRRATMEWRLAGIRSAFAAHNVPFDDERQVLVTAGFGTREACDALTHYLAQHTRAAQPTAVLAGGDFMAVGAAQALQAAQLMVPRDVSVMSMDGVNLDEVNAVPLTSLHVPRRELGHEAIRLLQRRFLRPEAPFGTVLLNGRLMLRHSVRRLGARRRPVADADLYGEV
ncbi:MAG: LacI family DNA-binding transcriptional regulator [Rhodocyclaceae bacterium]